MSLPLNILTFPLSGQRLIEACAGTGKTYTIAGLYLRLLLGHGDAETGRQLAHLRQPARHGGHLALGGHRSWRV